MAGRPAFIEPAELGETTELERCLSAWLEHRPRNDRGVLCRWWGIFGSLTAGGNPWMSFPPQFITPALISSGVRIMVDAGYSPNTTAMSLSVLKAFLRHLTDLEHISNDRYMELAAVTAPSHPPSSTASQRVDVNALVELVLADRTDDRWQQRDAIVLIAMGRWGLAPQELCRLNTSDVDRDTVVFEGRTIPIDSWELQLFDDYMRTRLTHSHAVTQRAVVRSHGPYTPSACYSLLKRLHRYTSQPLLRPHDLVTAARQRWYATTGDLFEVQRRSGVRSLHTLSNLNAPTE